jgi:hypothetical protein
VYPEEHRIVLPRRWQGVGEWFDAIDLDMVENCHFCREPLEYHELMEDRGQGLQGKGTTLVFSVGRDSRVASKLVAYRVCRPPEVEARINEIWHELHVLQTRYPIDGFRVRPVYPIPMYGAPKEVELTPGQWWHWVALTHMEHWHDCPPALKRHAQEPFIPPLAKVHKARAEHALGGTLFSSHEVTGYVHRNGLSR